MLGRAGKRESIVAQPIIEKSKGQTDKRIENLVASDFEREFGFRPDDEIEQRYFATFGERLTDPAMRESAERQARIRNKEKAPMDTPEEPPIEPETPIVEPEASGLLERVAGYIKPRKEGSQ
jgi:hypothetical protein